MLTKIKHKLISVAKSESEIIKNIGTPTIMVRYFSDICNWGDLLNVEVVEYVSQKKVINCPLGNRKHLLAIGSVLNSANNKSIIWGSGFISPEQKVNSQPVKVCAVRGPLTRAMLTEQGIECPEIYGDPALLLPEIYPLNNVEKKYDIGVIPHYEDANHQWISSIRKSTNVKIIDIQQSDTKSFLLDLLSCRHIASSSLHGLIASDAYGVPNCRLDFHNMRSFKFDDYYKGIGVDNYNTINIKQESKISISDIISLCTKKQLCFDANKLKNAFPHEQLNL